ncbi:TVP38/TMEM64 family protein [Teichococcus aestuarii]|uniref:TVP38/TMEM64 family protein n=1 Tax=Teichococcus aestuarii TaxID=568898 RepID=UPI0015E81AF7|nr:VTT domain-containing protein [Pseudoroseomonas aestuarii]
MSGRAARLLGNRRLWIGLGLVAAFLALRFSGLGEVFSLETLSRHQEALARLVAEHAALAALGYLAVYVGVAALSLPGATVLTLAGGFLFGAVAGTGLTLVGATAGATLLFLMARRLFGANALDRLGERARQLGENMRGNAASYLLMLRLAPVFPFFLVNLVPAFVGVRLPVFVATTLLGILPGTAVFSLAGAGLGEVLAAGGTPEISGVLTPRVVGALLGLAALSLLGIPLKARLSRGQS